MPHFVVHLANRSGFMENIDYSNLFIQKIWKRILSKKTVPCLRSLSFCVVIQHLFCFSGKMLIQKKCYSLQ